jgi:hypothetical protein
MFDARGSPTLTEALARAASVSCVVLVGMSLTLHARATLQKGVPVDDLAKIEQIMGDVIGKNMEVYKEEAPLHLAKYVLVRLGCGSAHNGRGSVAFL